MVLRRLTFVSLFVLLCIASGADAGGLKVAMLDGLGVSQGTAVIKLEKGLVKLKAALAPLPATVDTGEAIFEATFYRAYLQKSDDEAMEVSLGSVYPTSKEKAVMKVAYKGDLSGLGLDRIVVVAFSKDGLHSHDVLTGTIETP
jgi:hypothetical protein